MQRYLKSHILNDLENKYVLIMGPRQCGKTTLSKNLCTDFDYFNYDLDENRIALRDKSWDRKKSLIIFDELHKMTHWKQWLKGIYDTEGIPPAVVVTGSARMDIHRKAGDSLAGRYFEYRLHPFDIKEATRYLNQSPDEIFERIWHFGGFPEPFLKGEAAYYRRWRKTHSDIILRQDLIDLVSVRDISSIETLAQLLKMRVGSTVSYQNLARDLDRDPTTIKRWISLLENLYIIFRVTPYHNNIARSLLKEPKFYFYDVAMASHEDGARLENIVAASLLKECDYIEDTLGFNTSLHFLRTKDGVEVDFLVCIDEKPSLIIEVKTTDDSLCKGFSHFKKFLPDVPMIQLVHHLKKEKTYPDGSEVRHLVNWLSTMDLYKLIQGRL